jgi:2,3-bisphosphoglycerate-dependent phosphoglycerate mutase
MAKIVLVRHGESIWNALGRWQGWTDIDLTEKGLKQAGEVGRALIDIKFDYAFSSPLIRASKTLDEILKVLKQSDLAIIKDAAMIEKHYGIYTGKNKWQVKEEIGEAEFQKLRRAWDYHTLEGESMKQVYERLIPYYEQEILPKLKAGKNVIISSHGNTLRTLVKSLDNLTEDEVAKLEFGIGEAYVYDIDQTGQVTNKEIRNRNPLAGKQ